MTVKTATPPPAVPPAMAALLIERGGVELWTAVSTPLDGESEFCVAKRCVGIAAKELLFAKMDCKVESLQPFSGAVAVAPPEKLFLTIST